MKEGQVMNYCIIVYRGHFDVYKCICSFVVLGQPIVFQWWPRKRIISLCGQSQTTVCGSNW